MMQQRYTRSITLRITEYTANADWRGLTLYLDSLTHSAFRTACIILGGEALDRTERSTFWLLTTHLMLWQPKAFVVTMGKAVVRRVEMNLMAFDDEEAMPLYEQLRGPSHVIDRDKLLLLWLPICDTPAKMEFLLNNLDTVTIQHRLDFLLRIPNNVASFVILRTLRIEEHNRQLLLNTARQLMRRGDGLAFNLASLMRTFFDLAELRGTFSLNIPPYALSRLDTDFDAFCRSMQ